MTCLARECNLDDIYDWNPPPRQKLSLRHALEAYTRPCVCFQFIHYNWVSINFSIFFQKVISPPRPCALEFSKRCRCFHKFLRICRGVRQEQTSPEAVPNKSSDPSALHSKDVRVSSGTLCGEEIHASLVPDIKAYICKLCSLCSTAK